jgi:1-acyl-sn-glycerol-3-phosphate acyltransferase
VERGTLPGQTVTADAAVVGSAEPAAYERFHERVRARETGLFYDLCWWASVRPLLALRRVRAIDAHHVPASGAVILAPNHTSYIDHLLVAGVSGRRLSFMAKSALFDGPTRFVNWLGAFPVIRGGHDEASIATALAVLERGGCLVMYCEGTMSRDGLPRERAKSGIGRLALASGAPIVPVGIVGARRNGPLSFPRVTIRFGEPLQFERVEVGSRERDREIADEVLAEIKLLHRSLLDGGRALTRRPAKTTGAHWPGLR